MFRLALSASVLFSCALVASCAGSPEPETRDLAASTTGEVQSTTSSEPTGHALQEASGRLFKAEEFIFVIEREWDGEDEAGGWQIAYNTSTYATAVNGVDVYTWRCSMKVGMPRHTRRMGDVPTDRAARMTAEIVNAVTWPLLDRADPWTGQGAAFCIQQRAGMQAMFRARYPFLGAAVQPRD